MYTLYAPKKLFFYDKIPFCSLSRCIWSSFILWQSHRSSCGTSATKNAKYFHFDTTRLFPKLARNFISILSLNSQITLIICIWCAINICRCRQHVGGIFRENSVFRRSMRWACSSDYLQLVEISENILNGKRIKRSLDQYKLKTYRQGKMTQTE